MIMGRPKDETSINININSTALQRVYDMKVLGVIINHDLSYATHLEKTCNTINSRISFLSRIRDSLNPKILLQIFNAIILPHFDYGDVIWGHTYHIHLKRLYQLQKTAAKTILYESYAYSGSEAINRLKWLNEELRIKFHSTVYIFKALHNLTSNMTSNLFTFATTRYSSRINDNFKLSLLKPNNNFYMNSLFYNGIKCYNDLPLNIRSIEQISTFKSQVFDFFKQLM